MFRRSFLFIIFLLFMLPAFSQNKIVLINGKQIEAKNIEVGDEKVVYRDPVKNKLKKIPYYKIFSVENEKGKEQVLYAPDPLDSGDYSIPEMRMFIKGEQEADLYYRNNLNKGVAAAVGAASGLLTIYGLIIPPLYATIVGSSSPDVEKQKVSDPDLLNNLSFKEGYARRCRDRKTRNSLLYGFGGFIVGFAAYTVFLTK